MLLLLVIGVFAAPCHFVIAAVGCHCAGSLLLIIAVLVDAAFVSMSCFILDPATTASGIKFMPCKTVRSSNSHATLNPTPQTQTPQRTQDSQPKLLTWFGDLWPWHFGVWSGGFGV